MREVITMEHVNILFIQGEKRKIKHVVITVAHTANVISYKCNTESCHRGQKEI